MIACGLFEWTRICAGFLTFILYVFIKRAELGSYNRFKPAIFLFLPKKPGPGFPTSCVHYARYLTITSAISVYHHWICEFEPHSWRGVLNTTLCDKACQWLTTGRWFSRVLRFPPLIKPPRYNWNIVESGVKHHKPKPYHIIIVFFCLFSFFLFKECGIPTFLHSRPNICCHKNSARSFQRLFKVISYISILMVGKTHP